MRDDASQTNENSVAFESRAGVLNHWTARCVDFSIFSHIWVVENHKTAPLLDTYVPQRHTRIHTHAHAPAHDIDRGAKRALRREMCVRAATKPSSMLVVVATMRHATTTDLVGVEVSPEGVVARRDRARDVSCDVVCACACRGGGARGGGGGGNGGGAGGSRRARGRVDAVGVVSRDDDDSRRVRARARLACVGARACERERGIVCDGVCVCVCVCACACAFAATRRCTSSTMRSSSGSQQPRRRRRRQSVSRARRRESNHDSEFAAGVRRVSLTTSAVGGSRRP